ncbi:hypothetical protein HanIR_Chr10g0459701 [Helianthus annuus]|nr:hypothetical protein HanIR_Chr10g0459701 [Helianthus annuus]
MDLTQHFSLLTIVLDSKHNHLSSVFFKSTRHSHSMKMFFLSNAKKLYFLNYTKNTTLYFMSRFKP